jgi:single-stranded-DNA-specific exonuclease
LLHQTLNRNYQAQWEVLPPAPSEYLSAVSFPPLVAQLLYNRGVKSDEIEIFLSASQEFEGNPFLLPDMSQAVARIYKALLSREKIAIYGDFDVDGITATAVLAEGLSQFGGRVIVYTPDRFSEGHGLKSPAIEKLRNQGVKLIITVDCGITDLAEARRAREIGLDMIITDHHIPPASLPQAVAVIDARRRDSRYPFSELAGVGVAFKLVQAMFYKDNRGEKLLRLLDLVALGTVTDLVPLVGENRYLVKEGLEMLNNTGRIGLQEMVKLARLELGKLDAASISWALGPRLNAAGRMNDATAAYQLLTGNSLEEARRLAVELEQSNAERQRLTSEVLHRVKEQLDTKMDLPLFIDGDEGYPVGVIGLVAGKLVDEFYKPAIIINLGTEVCRGSARSIPEFNVTSSLTECQDLLIAFGGHPLAAGFTVSRQNLPRLEERLMNLAASQLSRLNLQPKLVIDAEVPLSSLGDAVSLIQQLEPFGKGNPQPTFLSRQVEVAGCRSLDSQDKHLRLKLKQGNVAWEAVFFNANKAQEEIPHLIDIVYNIEKSWWNGEEVLRLTLCDFVPSGQPR